MPKPDQNYRQIPFMKINAEILNKILKNRIQPYAKRIIHCDQVGLIEVCKSGLTFGSQSM